MRQWEIYFYPYPSEAQPHYFIVLSPDAVAGNPAWARVNALLCQTVRPLTRPAKDTEVYLDRADGFEWKTLVRCEFIYSFEKTKVLGGRKGRVSAARVEDIRQKLRQIF